MINEVGASLRPLAESKGLKFEIQLPTEEIIIRTDRRALSQVIINLTNNAIKFTEKGSVTIELDRRRDNGRVLTEIRVTDTGIGIKAEDQARLFQAFTQLETNTSIRRYEGTGLGLHLSQKMADLLGARITMESEYGKGSKFTLLIAEH